MRGKTIDHRNLTLGCGLLLLIAITGGVALVAMAFSWDRQAVAYPGTTTLSSQADYQGLPDYLILNDAFLTSAPLADVNAWYVKRFRLSTVTEGIASDECHVLYGSKTYLTVRRHIGVMVCNTPAGRRIQVTRSILLE